MIWNAFEVCAAVVYIVPMVVAVAQAEHAVVLTTVPSLRDRIPFALVRLTAPRTAVDPESTSVTHKRNGQDDAAIHDSDELLTPNVEPTLTTRVVAAVTVRCTHDPGAIVELRNQTLHGDVADGVEPALSVSVTVRLLLATEADIAQF